MADSRAGKSNSAEARRRSRRRKLRRRHSRGRRWATVALLALVLAVIAAYRAMTSHARLRRITQAYLQQFFTSDVHVGDASFSLMQGIQLSGVTVADPDGGADAPAMLSFAGMWLRHEPWALLGGRFRVDEVVATRPVCRARFDTRDGRFNLQEVFRLPESGGTSRGMALPEVRILDAQLYVFPNARRDAAPVDDISLSLTGRFDTGNSRKYDVAWVTRTDRRSRGHFVVDLKNGVIEDREGGAPWLSLQSASLALEAGEPRAKRWIDLLGVEGRFRIVDYRFRFRHASDVMSHLAVELDNASLSIPLDRSEESLPADDRFLRLEHVGGRIKVDDDGAIAELTGTLRGAPCRLSGRLRGDVGKETTFADVGFDVKAELSDFQLPRTEADAPPYEVRLVDRWQKLRHFYRDFAPRGKVDITAELTKSPGADARVELRRAEIEALGAEVTMLHFPYRVSNVTGEVAVTPDGVFINGLKGWHTSDQTIDGEIICDGWVSELRLTSAAILYITGKGIALDEDLCAAIKGRHRHTWDRFSPSGLADIDVVMTREAGVDTPMPWAIDIDAQLAGVDISFDGFHYPLRDLTGAVRVSGDMFAVSDVSGRCGQGDVRADGFVRSTPAGLTAMDLVVQADAVPIDNVMRDALPEDSRERFAELEPAGVAAIDVHLTDEQTPAGAKDVAYDIMVGLADARVCPKAFPLLIDKLAGRVRIQRDRIDVIGLAGAASGGSVRVSGRIPRTASGERDVAISGEGIVLTDALRNALPEDVQTRLADWRLDGGFDVDGHIGDASGARTFRMALDGTEVVHNAIPLLWRVTSGDVVVDGEDLEIHDIRAASGDAELALSGRIANGSGTFDGSLMNLSLNDVLRDVLPWRLRRTWNNVEPAGTVDLLDARIGWSQAQGESEPTWTITGTTALHDFALSAGVRMDGIEGRIPFSGEAKGTLTAASLMGDVSLDRLRIGKHTLEDVRARLLRDGVGDRLYLNEIQARLYDGTLTGEVTLDRQDGDAQYGVNATLRRGDVRALVNAGRDADEQVPASEMSGFVDGRFYLTGSANDRPTRQGGGRVRVREAQLYKVPLLLAVLNVVNLAIPEESAFQEAGADLTVVGDELRFANIELIGQAMSMIGEGTMQLSSGKLDIRLVTVSPHRWAEMPVVTEMLEGVSRELIEVQVTGTLSEPIATAHPLRNMEAALAALLTLQQLPPPPATKPIVP